MGMKPQAENNDYFNQTNSLIWDDFITLNSRETGEVIILHDV